jgi:hypothetical protein
MATLTMLERRLAEFSWALAAGATAASRSTARPLILRLQFIAE